MKSGTTRRKPRPKRTPYDHKPGGKSSEDTPVTSAKQQNTGTRENLTLHDWMTVFAYIDEHPSVSQEEVVQHFAALHTGALEFTQPTLSRKLKARTNLEQRIDDNPSALSSKRPRIVTRPDVEKALIIWVRAMGDKGEYVTGTMLREKRKRFEDLLGVPEEERLSSDGWVASFTRTYHLRGRRRHGKAVSADLAAAEAEQEPTAKILAKFDPKHHSDFGETSLFAYAPPDRGSVQCPGGPSGETPTPQIIAVEEDLKMAEELHRWKGIEDLDPLVNGLAEPGEAGEAQMKTDKVNGEVVEISDDEEEEGESDLSAGLSLSEVSQMREKLEAACLTLGYSDNHGLSLLRELRRFRGFLRRMEMKSAKQSTLDSYWEKRDG